MVEETQTVELRYFDESEALNCIQSEKLISHANHFGSQYRDALQDVKSVETIIQDTTLVPVSILVENVVEITLTTITLSLSKP